MVAAVEARMMEGKALVFGFVMAAMIVATLLAARPAQAAVFTVDRVTNESDASLSNPLCDANAIQVGAQCTLRAAIEQSNATAGADVINFNIPGTGVKTIAPGSPLPAIEDPVTIDGYSQPGTSKNTLTKGTNAVLLIELSGANAGEGTTGLDIRAPSLVTGLVINRFNEFIDMRGGIRSGGDGIRIASSNTKVEGNFIGTDPSGTIDLGNEAEGIKILGGDANTIGGTSPDKRNLISGNDGDGVQTTGSDGKMEGNLIGTSKDGAGSLGNSGTGVRTGGTSSNNIIGGASAAAANTIAFNGGDGVKIDIGEDDIFGTGNRISRNSIFSNVGIGIDLIRSVLEGDSDRTANDPPPDADTGPNNLQNYPIITSATTTDVKTTVAGKLKSSLGTTFKIQFFSNPSGTNEGKKFLGQTSVTTGPDGLATFVFEPARRVVVGQTITATATDPEGNTSEFSSPRSVLRQ